MKKIPTLLVRDPHDRSRVSNDLSPVCAWALDPEEAPHVAPTRKRDGVCVRLDADGVWWTRREVKAGRMPPDGFRLAEYDKTTGKAFGFEPSYRSGFNAVLDVAIALRAAAGVETRQGTYELCGPTVNGNPERVDEPTLFRHGAEVVPMLVLVRDVLAVRAVVEALGHRGVEGVVWHHADGRRAKLKARDL